MKVNRRQPISSVVIVGVLRHIGQYRLAVLDSLKRVPEFKGLQAAEIHRVMRILEHRALIAAAPLHRGVVYWYLLPAGARRLGLTEDRCGWLSEPAKIRAYALLRFCCLTSKSHVRLTREEIVARMPEVGRPGMPSTYYYDPSGPGRLGIARVDAGHHGRWDRVVQSIREDVAAHHRYPAWRRLMAAGRFEFTLLTILPEKAQRIVESLAQYPDVRRCLVQIVAMSELLPLIISMPRKEVLSL